MPNKESKTPNRSVDIIMMYMLGDQSLFGDGGDRGRRGEGVGGDLS